MGTSMAYDTVDLTPTIDVARFLIVDCHEAFAVLRRVLGESSIDPFKIEGTVAKIIEDVLLRCLIGEGRTTLDILEDLRTYRIARPKVIDALLFFEDFIYTDLELRKLQSYTLVDVKRVHDRPCLEIEYHEKKNQEELVTFNRFVEEYRAQGNDVHPAVDRLLEEYYRGLEYRAAQEVFQLLSHRRRHGRARR